MSYSIRPHLTPFFAEIEATKLIRHALDIASMTVDTSMYYEPSPVLVVGKPGNGKSTALLKLELEQSNIVYIQASSSQTNLNGLLEGLLAAMDVHHGRKHLRDMMELVMDNFDSQQLIVLVDEYQTFNLNAIRELMRMCESSLTPLVLVGNKERLKATGSEKNCS